MGIPAFVKNRS